jgi:hypothetical protein
MMDEINGSNKLKIPPSSGAKELLPQNWKAVIAAS